MSTDFGPLIFARHWFMETLNGWNMPSFRQKPGHGRHLMNRAKLATANRIFCLESWLLADHWARKSVDHPNQPRPCYQLPRPRSYTLRDGESSGMLVVTTRRKPIVIPPTKWPRLGGRIFSFITDIVCAWKYMRCIKRQRIVFSCRRWLFRAQSLAWLHVRW